ncbi:hypothetical protein [Arachnia rubra]|uniref:Uncharacterized protein n=1 Tax=Arachnia rubra TaxID=1547448 RepID=A0ABX7Y8Q8_9ACTN|nr:hypothetical protein [Arachnia rubra]MBB1572231.1 hypothetical protein [Propionibacterium sp.]MBB1576861.1 hypothetical protein [Propionibacterium sp.]QUC09625.1 hypothetical protein J5A65_05815 [Arachnia rubra]BCR80698.1 hypothetical protein SK1NUM_11410 [Arachnia rubra]
MNKRASLPGASELFRPTKAPEPVTPAAPADPEKAKPQKSEPQGKEKASRPVASGRIRHDQKITVYFSSEELFALEDATLELKRRHGINLDRGRLVRTAVALALLDLAENGADSAVVAELNQK